MKPSLRFISTEDRNVLLAITTFEGCGSTAKMCGDFFLKAIKYLL